MLKPFTLQGFLDESNRIEPADRPFSYDACPVGSDGRRRAVTRDGREVVLLAGDAPGDNPVVGWVAEPHEINEWRADGSYYDREDGSAYDLLVPPPPKRVVWTSHIRYLSEADADKANNGCARLGNRAFPIEIDAEPMTDRETERQKLIEAMAPSVEAAECGYHMKLVSLVDGVSTYDLAYDDGEHFTFGSTDECYAHIAQKRAAARADAALTAIAEQGYAVVPKRNDDLPNYPKSLSARWLVNDWIAAADLARPDKQQEPS